MSGIFNSGSNVFNEKFNLLIIDPQNDFIDLPYTGSNFGRLPVVNAKNDIPKISDLILNHKDNINKIVVSMDTHTIFHIGHRFWRSNEGSIAPGGTTFSVDGDKIMGTLGPNKTEYVVNVNDSDRPAMNKYAKKYIEMVATSGKTDGRNIPCTWSVHCIQGTEGWKVHPDLENALNTVQDKVQYHIKGQNQLAEMYSIMKAEVAYEDVINTLSEEEQSIVNKYIYNPTKGDSPEFTGEMEGGNPISNFKTFVPTNTMPVIGVNDNSQYNLQTTFNNELFTHLTENDSNIVVCGEALSHCVQFSTRDIVNEISKQGLSNKVYIIENASSPVDVDAIGLLELTKIFKASANGFINDMLKGSNTGVLNYNGALTIKTSEIPNVVKSSTVPAILNYTKHTFSSSQKTKNGKNGKGGRRTRKNNKKSKKSRKHRKKGGKRTRRH